MDRRTRRRIAATLTLAVTVMLSGCAQESSKRTVELDSPKNPVPTVVKGPAVTSASMPSEGQFTRGNSSASTPDELAVEEAWFAYYSALVSMYVGPTVDRIGLGSVAIGSAYDDPITYAEDLMAREIRNSGGAIASLTTVKVEGDVAEVTGCLRSTLLEVDDKGQPIEAPDAPFQVTTERLVRDGDTWLVSSHALEGKACEL